MAVKYSKTKKAFIFSLFAIFVSFLFFGFASLYLFQDSYSKENTFKEFRVVSLNNELSYFKDTYLKNALSFTFYNTVNSLLNYTSYNYTYVNDHEKLNQLIYEGIINGSFEGNLRNDLINKTLIDFIEIYNTSLSENNYASLDFNLEKINVFEEDSYYLSLQAEVTYYLGTVDNISSWNISDSFIVSTQFFDLSNPEFILSRNNSILIETVDVFAGNVDWDESTLNDTLNYNLLSIYEEPSHSYTIGNSFIRRMLNISEGSYKNVWGFWSFDNDLANAGVFDSSLRNELATHRGNTISIYSFDNETIILDTIFNSILSGPNASNNGANCNVSGIKSEGCSFDGVDDFINISDSGLVNISENFSISIWTKFFDSRNNVGFIGKGTGNPSFNTYFNGGVMYLDISDDLGNSLLDIELSENLSDNIWHNVILVKKSDILYSYIDGFLESETNLSSLTGFLDDDSDITLGGGPNNFLGTIDEFAFYTKSLETENIAEIYESKQSILVDYYDSFFGEEVYFDGVDDYIVLNINSSFDFSNEFSLEFWIKPTDVLRANTVFDSTDLLKTKGFKLSINQSVLQFSSSAGTSINSYENIEDKLTYITITYDGINNISMYVNSNMVNSSSLFAIADSDDNVYFGSDVEQTNFYIGSIDEIRLKNVTMPISEIKNNFYNFKANAKGCCNYISLINPNTMGYNISPTYDENISYSSKIFYDYYERGIDKYNITLYELTNLSSNVIDEPFYNLKFDICLMQAYSVFDYDPDPQIIVGSNESFDCSYLVTEGIY